MITVPDFQKKQIVFVFFNEGEKMAISNDNLIVKNADGSIKFQCTCYRLFLVFAVGNYTITSVVLQKAKKFGFYIACLTSGFRLYSIIGAEKNGNTLLKRKQYNYSGNDIGIHIIKNKIINQRDVIKANRYKSDSAKECIKHLEQYANSINITMTLSEIMAYEGLAARLYFQNHFNNVLWNGRQPRLKKDYINSALDIGYTLMFTFIECILECYGFDTYIGVFHRQFYMRKSLVCDIIEPFRPLIDITVKKGINLKQIKESDFKNINNQQRLKYEYSGKYVKLFMTPLIEEKDKIFKYIQNYYYLFMKGANGDTFPVFSIYE